MSEIKVVATNIAKQKGTPKTAVPELVIDEFGVRGDAHAGLGQRQVSLLSKESIDEFVLRTKKKIAYGAFGENLTISGIKLSTTTVLDKLQINDVILEITQVGKKCHGDVCAIYREVGQCVMPQEGVFSRVVSTGTIKVGDEVKYLPYCLKILIITLSDRAHAGVYPDQSGLEAKKLITDFFTSTKWHWQIEQLLLPDDADLLKEHLECAINDRVDIIFTLGGTGIGPKDFTVETVNTVCDKIIPGVMEHIRVKYSANPNVWLSRSILGIAKQTQIYTLPGSVRAVSEYLEEIFKVLEHAIFMIHALDKHEKIMKNYGEKR